MPIWVLHLQWHDAGAVLLGSGKVHMKRKKKEEEKGRRVPGCTWRRRGRPAVDGRIKKLKMLLGSCVIIFLFFTFFFYYISKERLILQFTIFFNLFYVLFLKFSFVTICRRGLYIWVHAQMYTPPCSPCTHVTKPVISHSLHSLLELAGLCLLLYHG